VDAHQPAPYDKDILMAVRACIAGKANEGQQKLAMDWIITKASNLYDMSYRPDGKGGARATEFHEGRRFVGNQIVKMTRPETLQALEVVKPVRGKRQEAKND
jgi:hypothetical protein